jgi:hypothetical protein
VVFIKKTAWLMALYVWLPVLFAVVVKPAHGRVLPSCSDQALLSDVRNLIISSNKLPETVVVQFTEVKTLRNVPAPYFNRATQQAELACSAMVGLVLDDSADGKAAELVESFYGLTVQKANNYQVYFQPNRPKK